MWLQIWAIIKKLEPILCWVMIALLVAMVGWMVYVTMIKPHTNPTPTQQVQSGGIAYTYDIKVGFGGCARIPMEVKNK